MFSLRVEAAQREIERAVARSTETILMQVSSDPFTMEDSRHRPTFQLNSGPHNLIQDDDIREVWKGRCPCYQSFSIPTCFYFQLW